MSFFKNAEPMNVTRGWVRQVGAWQTLYGFIIGLVVGWLLK